jgi:hypothetical protein
LIKHACHLLNGASPVRLHQTFQRTPISVIQTVSLYRSSDEQMLVCRPFSTLQLCVAQFIYTCSETLPGLIYQPGLNQ